MAVEAVASVVIQKLTDMLTDKESISNEKLIVDQLEEIKKALEKMGGYFIDAEDKQRIDETVKEWAEEYLKYVYYVEDTIESFALRIARQRKSMGFLMKHALFLKNFTACRKLRRKMKRIRVKIRQLNLKKPGGVENASLGSRRSLQSHPESSTRSAAHFDEKGTVAGEQKEEEEEDDGREDEKEERQLETLVVPEREKVQELKANGLMHRHATSTNLEVRTERLQLRSLSDASLIGERLNQYKLMRSYSYDEEELDIVGFQREVSVLVESLTEKNISDLVASQTERNVSRSIISIVGEMGSGKTTLARKVYGNREIKGRFECCAWVTVPKEANAIDLLLKLLKQVGNSKDQGGLISEEYLQTRLLERLKDKRYLIVLDDLRSSHIWDYLKDAFPNNRNGSKIILITRQEQVAVYAESRFRLKKMSHQDSWTLFKKKAGLEEGPENLRKTILQASNRLPLNIVLLGSLFATKKEDENVHEWQAIPESRDGWETGEILSSCYNDVPVSSKLCLLYMVLFPKEFDIPVRRLLRLWQAEGFVKRPEETDTFPEDEAQKYFDDLVIRSLIQVSKVRSDGSPKKCRLLGVLHDYLLPRATDISLFHVHWRSDSPRDEKPDEKPFGVRRLVEYTDIKTCSFYQSRHRERLRSFLSFNVQKKDTPAKEVGSLLDDIIRNGKSLLRVLDLEGVYKPSLPENLGDFFHLRYLGLRWTFLDTLPQSVGDLYYLETLDVKHTNINTLPPSIWKLKHLRHLNLNEIRLDMGRNLRSSIPDLLTLWGLSVDHESMVKGGLNRLIRLRELGITFHLSSSEELMDWISQLTDLQMLRLRSKDDECHPSKLVLKPLSKLGKLSSLYLLGNLTRLPEKQDFPQEIKVLTLSVSLLQDDPMPILGQLKYLTVLKLLAHSYMGTSMTCTLGGFKELRVLKLWMLENLVKWDVEEKAMEKLKELNIRFCNKLRSMPGRLLKQRKFKELTLTNMPREFREQVENVQKEFGHFSITVKNLELSSWCENSL